MSDGESANGADATPAGEITRLLHEAHEGREGALDEVMELVYSDLKRLAEIHLRRRYGPNLKAVTLEPAALVNETYLRLIKQRQDYDSRGHFFAIATRLMLRVLMDYARAKSREKRGGDWVRVSLSDVPVQIADDPAVRIDAFVDAVEKLEQLDTRTADVTKLRLVWGLTIAEIGKTLGLSTRTVEREWRFARRWLATRFAEGTA